MICFLLEVVAYLVTIVLFCLYQRRHFSYWKDRGIPYIESDWLFGSITNEIFKRSSWNEYSTKCYNNFKRSRFVGGFLFRKPMLIICDARIVEDILVRDFAFFHDRGYSDSYEALSKTLFNAKGEKWRLMRQSLAPSFTAFKIKGIFDQTSKCSDYVITKISETMKRNDSLEVDSLVFVYVVEVMASVVFGVQLLKDGREDENFKRTISTIYSTNPLRTVKFLLVLLFPKICKTLGIQLFEQSVTDFFVNLTRATIEYRVENNIVRNDFLQLMIQLKDQGKKNKPPYDVSDFQCPGISPSSTTEVLDEKLITDDEVAALLFSFITAGLRPSAGIIGFALFEVAKNQTIQKTLQEDIDNAIRKHKDWSYGAVKDMTYLDQVVQEALRMYNFNPFLVREVTEPYQMPDSSLVLDKGMLVYVPVAGLHTDPRRYPSPHVFDPERFAGNNYKPNPFFLPFGNGPRFCIAVKFAVLTIKVCLSKVLSKYAVGVGNGMRLPLELDRNEFYPKAKNGIWLKFVERN